MSVRVAIQVTLAGAILGAWILACVGSDYAPTGSAPDAASDGGGDASVPPETGSPAAPCTCVESPADGWSVPGYLLRDATCAAPVPMEAFKLYTDVSGAPATCGHCSCKSQPTSTSCTAPSIASYTSGTCPPGAPTGTPIHLTGANCYANPNATITSYRAETGLVQGTCDATSDAIAEIPPLQKTDLRLCVPAGPGAGTCAKGLACRPDPPTGGSPAPLCVAHPGDVECPDGYSVRQRLNATYEDKRRCTTCSCTFSGSGCTYTVKAYSAAGCTGTLLTTATSGPTCLSGSPKSFRVTEGTVTDATCGNPQGGEPTGEVEVSDAVTVCCKP
jgi:hypothetical protein